MSLRLKPLNQFPRLSPELVTHPLVPGYLKVRSWDLPEGLRRRAGTSHTHSWRRFPRSNTETSWWSGLKAMNPHRLGHSSHPQLYLSHSWQTYRLKWERKAFRSKQAVLTERKSRLIQKTFALILKDESQSAKTTAFKSGRFKSTESQTGSTNPASVSTRTAVSPTVHVIRHLLATVETVNYSIFNRTFR